ncbi:MAG: hypothetical protein Q9210_006849, partial [Variospora velana]
MCIGRRSTKAREPSSPIQAPHPANNIDDDLSSAFQSLSVHSVPDKTTTSIQHIQVIPTPLPTPPPSNPSFPPSKIPTFPRSQPPTCPHCGWIPKYRNTVLPSNPNGNADRPYYICVKCKENSANSSPDGRTKTSRQRDKPGWISWDDKIGIHHKNRPCFCGYASRQDRAGVDSYYPGGGFWTCALGACDYLSFRKDGLTIREAQKKGFENYDDGFEPWLLRTLPGRITFASLAAVELNLTVFKESDWRDHIGSICKQSMADSDSDEDLKRAIQLSLQSVEPQVKASGVQVQRNIINFDSDDETKTDESDTEIRGQKKDLPEPEVVSVAASTGMLGLDRKAMEQDRLARKRKASISPPPPRKVARHIDSTPKFLTSRSTAEKVLLDKQSTLHALPSHASPPALTFPKGTVKKTWLFGYPRQGDDIKIEEILQKNDLGIAVLSSFQWDVEWLLRKLNTKTTQVVLVMQADTAEIKAQYRQETASMPNLRLCFPSMEGQINCMHSKLMLLSYPSHLRIVVPTANLVPYDWGETGVMENMVYLIDLARLPTPQPTSQQKMTDFSDDLIYFLQAMGLDQSIIDSLYHFDFSATRDLAFVHTIGGAHTGDDEPWRRTGYCGLGRAISRLGLASNDQQALDINYVTSSIGSLNLEFLSTLYLAARGDDGTKEYYEWRNVTLGKKAKDYSTQMKRKADAQEQLRKEIDEGFRIYFPSQETVKASKGGPGCGGTICFQRKWWESSTFPRQLMRDCKSRRGGALMHNK